MITFEKYTDEFLNGVVAVFRSNVPRYFLETEEQDLISDIPGFKDTYYVMFQDSDIIGAGGFALNDDDTVALCWGMLHNNCHKQGLGEALLSFRLKEIAKHYPKKTIVNTTSQHTTGFFEKYGFKTVSIVKDGFGAGLDACKMELEAGK